MTDGERWEQIWQLEEKVARAVNAAAFCFKSPGFGQQARILARLESALANLKRGMKEQP